MAHRSTRRPTRTIGLDVSDLTTSFCVLDDDGSAVERGRCPTTAEGLRAELGSRPRARVALEATTHSPWIARLVAELGHQPVVAHPAAAARLADRIRKTDERDAEMLARTARLDPKLLAPIQHRTAQQQQDRALLLSRDRLVRLRASLVLFVRGSVKPLGGRIRGLTTRSFGRKALEQIPKGLRPALVPQLQVIEEISRQIARLDRQIATVARQRYPQTALLRQVDGVGPVTALAYVLTIHDPDRFTVERVASYLGLVPRRNQSGQYDPDLPITRAGDRFVRRLMIQCAQHMLGPHGKDSALRRWGLALKARGSAGSGQRAAVAVARRLAGVLLALWKTGAVSRPAQLASP